MSSTETAPTERIVVGVDGSESSTAALRWAARQAELTGSELEVMMTWEWPTNFGWALPFPTDYDPTSDAQKVLDGVIAELHTAATVLPHLVQGHAAVVLIEASAGADLLVVGSRGHGEFAGMVIGSVSEHCVAHAHCPVVVVRDRR